MREREWNAAKHFGGENLRERRKVREARGGRKNDL